MKVSIDGLLGSAKNIKNQRQVEEESPERRQRGDVKVDSVKIENRVDTRLDSIQKELREIQTSLTRNQIIREGMGRLADDLGKGGQNISLIMDEVTFEGSRVLYDYTGDSVTPSILRAKEERIDTMITDDVNRLTRLQIEVENIMASSMASVDKVSTVMKNVESAFSRTTAGNLNSISNLRPDAVMRLIK